MSTYKKKRRRKYTGDKYKANEFGRRMADPKYPSPLGGRLDNSFKKSGDRRRRIMT